MSAVARIDAPVPKRAIGLTVTAMLKRFGAFTAA